MSDEFNRRPSEMLRLPDEMLYRKNEDNGCAPEFSYCYGATKPVIKKKSRMTKLLLGTLMGTVTLTGVSLFNGGPDINNEISSSVNEETIEDLSKMPTDNFSEEIIEELPLIEKTP